MKHHYVYKGDKLERILNGLKRKMIFKGLALASGMNSPQLQAFMVGHAGMRIRNYGKKGKPVLWMLGKEGLKEDFLETLRGSDWVNPLDFSRGIPKQLAKIFLPPGLDDNNYADQDESVEASKVEYRQLWQQLFHLLPASKRPKGITTGNFGYYAERELAYAAELEGIPFIAMHKECLKSTGRLEFFKTVYSRRGRFQGRKILVYNDRERQLQIDSGIASTGQVIKCGMPRLDRLHHWRLSGAKREKHPPTLLAMGFTPNTGLPRIPHKGLNGNNTSFEYLNDEHQDMQWTNFFVHYHEVLVKIARDNPDWKVQLKLKSRYRDAQPSIDLVKKLGITENFEILVGGDPLEHITKSDVICGFNTTALLEGLAAGIPVVTPEFDEVIDPVTSDFAVSFGNATLSPNDPESMYVVLSDLMKRLAPPNIELSNEVKDELETWVGNPDGLAGQRVRAVFESEMEIVR